MTGLLGNRKRLASTLRWTARIWSVASVGLVLAFMIGEGFNPSGFQEWIGVLLFPIGICLGMIVAWWKEGPGGGVTVVCLVAFYVFQRFTSGRFPKGWAWLTFAVPGFLFLLSALLYRKSRIRAA